MRRLLLLLFILTVFSQLTRAQTCNLNATTANFSSQLAAAQPGQTLCLATGNYGTFNGVTKSSPGVTITKAAGATPTMSIFFGNTPAVAWLILDHLTISGGLISGAINNVTFQNNSWTDKLVIWGKGPNNGCSACVDLNNSNIVFNGEDFNMAANQSGTGGFEGRVQLADGGATPWGVTFKNSKFHSGCADGIQISGNNAAWGATIGPGNEFFNLLQGSCGPHIDSIQFVGTGAIGPVIDGNYFHDDSTGIVGYDYANDATITNNVLERISTAVLGGQQTGIVFHNTVYDNVISCGVTHQGNACNATITNNISTGLLFVGTNPPNDYNLCTQGPCGGSGTHNLTGTPTYVGGSSPSTYAGFALTSSSLGHAAGSDGKDMGTIVSGSISSQPNPPTGLTAAVQ